MPSAIPCDDRSTYFGGMASDPPVDLVEIHKFYAERIMPHSDELTYAAPGQTVPYLVDQDLDRLPDLSDLRGVLIQRYPECEPFYVPTEGPLSLEYFHLTRPYLGTMDPPTISLVIDNQNPIVLHRSSVTITATGTVTWPDDGEARTLCGDALRETTLVWQRRISGTWQDIVTQVVGQDDLSLSVTFDSETVTEADHGMVLRAVFRADNTTKCLYFDGGGQEELIEEISVSVDLSCDDPTGYVEITGPTTDPYVYTRPDNHTFTAWLTMDYGTCGVPIPGRIKWSIEPRGTWPMTGAGLPTRTIESTTTQNVSNWTIDIPHPIEWEWRFAEFLVVVEWTVKDDWEFVQTYRAEKLVKMHPDMVSEPIPPCVFTQEITKPTSPVSLLDQTRIVYVEALVGTNVPEHCRPTGEFRIATRTSAGVSTSIGTNNAVIVENTDPLTRDAYPWKIYENISLTYNPSIIEYQILARAFIDIHVTVSPEPLIIPLDCQLQDAIKPTITDATGMQVSVITQNTTASVVSTVSMMGTCDLTNARLEISPVTPGSTDSYTLLESGGTFGNMGSTWTVYDYDVMFIHDLDLVGYNIRAVYTLGSQVLISPVTFIAIQESIPEPDDCVFTIRPSLPVSSTTMLTETRLVRVESLVGTNSTDCMPTAEFQVAAMRPSGLGPFLGETSTQVLLNTDTSNNAIYPWVIRQDIMLVMDYTITEYHIRAVASLPGTGEVRISANSLIIPLQCVMEDARKPEVTTTTGLPINSISETTTVTVTSGVTVNGTCDLDVIRLEIAPDFRTGGSGAFSVLGDSASQAGGVWVVRRTGYSMAFDPDIAGYFIRAVFRIGADELISETTYIELDPEGGPTPIPECEFLTLPTRPTSDVSVLESTRTVRVEALVATTAPYYCVPTGEFAVARKTSTGLGTFFGTNNAVVVANTDPATQAIYPWRMWEDITLEYQTSIQEYHIKARMFMDIDVAESQYPLVISLSCTMDNATSPIVSKSSDGSLVDCIGSNTTVNISSQVTVSGMCDLDWARVEMAPVTTSPGAYFPLGGTPTKNGSVWNLLATTISLYHDTTLSGYNIRAVYSMGGEEIVSAVTFVCMDVVEPEPTECTITIRPSQPVANPATSIINSTVTLLVESYVATNSPAECGLDGAEFRMAIKPPGGNLGGFFTLAGATVNLNTDPATNIIYPWVIRQNIVFEYNPTGVAEYHVKAVAYMGAEVSESAQHLIISLLPDCIPEPTYQDPILGTVQPNWYFVLQDGTVNVGDGVIAHTENSAHRDMIRYIWLKYVNIAGRYPRPSGLNWWYDSYNAWVSEAISSGYSSTQAHQIAVGNLDTAWLESYYPESQNPVVLEMDECEYADWLEDNEPAPTCSLINAQTPTARVSGSPYTQIDATRTVSLSAVVTIQGGCSLTSSSVLEMSPVTDVSGSNYSSIGGSVSTTGTTGSITKSHSIPFSSTLLGYNIRAKFVVTGNTVYSPVLFLPMVVDDPEPCSLGQPGLPTHIPVSTTLSSTTSYAFTSSVSVTGTNCTVSGNFEMAEKRVPQTWTNIGGSLTNNGSSWSMTRTQSLAYNTNIDGYDIRAKFTMGGDTKYSYAVAIWMEEEAVDPPDPTPVTCTISSVSQPYTTDSVLKNTYRMDRAYNNVNFVTRIVTNANNACEPEVKFQVKKEVSPGNYVTVVQAQNAIVTSDMSFGGGFDWIAQTNLNLAYDPNVLSYRITATATAGTATKTSSVRIVYLEHAQNDGVLDSIELTYNTMSVATTPKINYATTCPWVDFDPTWMNSVVEIHVNENVTLNDAVSYTAYHENRQDVNSVVTQATTGYSATQGRSISAAQLIQPAHKNTGSGYYEYAKTGTHRVYVEFEYADGSKTRSPASGTMDVNWRIPWRDPVPAEPPQPQFTLIDSFDAYHYNYQESGDNPRYYRFVRYPGVDLPTGYNLEIVQQPYVDNPTAQYRGAVQANAPCVDTFGGTWRYQYGYIAVRDNPQGKMLDYAIHTNNHVWPDGTDNRSISIWYKQPYAGKKVQFQYRIWGNGFDQTITATIRGINAVSYRVPAPWSRETNTSLYPEAPTRPLWYPDSANALQGTFAPK